MDREGHVQGHLRIQVRKSAATPIRYGTQQIAPHYRDKERQAMGPEAGRMVIVMALPEAKEMLRVIWYTWHSLSKRQALARNTGES